MQLDPDDIEEIAHRVAELIVPTDGANGSYVDAATLADELGVDRDWVYAHASELGAIRLGGPRGRLRFDRRKALEALADGSHATTAQPRRPARRRRAGRPAKPTDLIPYDS